MDIPHREKGTYVFGRFRLDPVRRALTWDAAPVPLTALLFDALLYLVAHPDRLVTRDELLSAVWQGRAVEDGSLQKAISAVRKALHANDPAEDFISTVTGRGFQFVMPVVFEPEAVARGSFAALAAPTVATAGSRVWASRVVPAGLALSVLLLTAGLVLRHGQKAARAFAPPPHSVAVLALTNLSGDPGQEYFSDGLSEELIDSLSRIESIRVAARVSAFSFKGSRATIADIAQKLNVGTVLEGSVRRQGARVRIDVQLIDANTGFPVWSRGYDRDRFQDDILHVEADIATSVSTALQVKLLGADAAQLALGGSHNPRAFDAYLRGMADSQGWDNAPVRQAIQDFNDAIALDPGFAAAYVGRASMLRVLASTGGVSDVDRATESAQSDVDHAITLEPLLPEAHRVRAEILFYKLDFAGASAEMTRALDLAPGNSRILSSYGLFETKLGHIEAGVATLRRAVTLDPLQPAAYRALAAGLCYARQYNEALEALHRYTAIDQHPNRSTQYMESTIDLAKGDAASAARLCQGDDAYADICLAMAYHALGRTEEAAARLARLQKSQGDNAAFNYAYIYAQWGKPTEALRWLRTAVKVSDSSLGGLKTNPFLDPIRGLPEFQDIQRQLNFPP